MQPNFHSPLLYGRRPPVMRDPRILYPIKRGLPPIAKNVARRRLDTKITYALTGAHTLQYAEIEDALTRAGSGDGRAAFKLVTRINSRTDYVIVGDGVMKLQRRR